MAQVSKRIANERRIRKTPGPSRKDSPQPTSISASRSSRKMIGPDEALHLVLGEKLVRQAQAVPLSEACGMQLAEPITADRDFPAFPRAMMDGYAVTVADAGRTINVIGEVAAGHEAPGSVEKENCYEIMTGAPCPPGTEAVVQNEHVRRDGDHVALPNRIELGQHIAPRGSECRHGEVVLQPGRTISPLGVAVIASCGRESVQVVPRPRLAVITTGTELVSTGTTPGLAQIRDSNGPMLVAMARDMGLHTPSHRHADDRIVSLLDALRRSAEADIVLLTGGVSAGNYDLVPKAIEDYGATTIFHKVNQKPGKPLLMARKNEQLIFGLPGNPLASHFCFHRYVAAAIRQIEGKAPDQQPLRGTLIETVRRKPARTNFVPARASRDNKEVGRWTVRPVPGVSSADIFASCHANCYVEVPRGSGSMDAGEVLSFTWIGNAPWPN